MSDDFDIGEEAAEFDELSKAKAQINRLSRQLYETKHKHADYLEAVETAVKEAVERIDIAPVESIVWNAGATDAKEEYAVALLSDLQTGKRTPDYDSDICRDRVMRYARKIVDIATIQRLHHPVRHCVVPMLGDMIEGIDIFPGQQYLVDSTLYDQLFNTTPTILADFVRFLLGHFETVTVYAVDGNHGRIGRRGQFGPMDNADRMLYRILAMLMRDEPRFKLIMTDPKGERNWYQVMQLGTYKALLIHGDQIRGHSGFPWYGLGKKVQGWGSGGLGADSDFKDVFMGHYHQLARVPLNHRAVYCNGSTESTNTFAAECLAAQSEPTQWLLFVDPTAGRVTASYGVELS
ncbi:hypothetical protein [Streptomyces sp. NPDC002855]|uniref:hypothetical protein n=1 Tax=Streptomyces sp. NPDC002855 TaxID=3154437 RepID=UPI003324A559